MSIAEFVPAGQMTEAEYDAERARIRATYGDTATERRGAFDQDLARLLAKAYDNGRGLTYERLATKEGKGRKWIERHLRFGSFLENGPTGPIPKNCTEGRFRSYWERTDELKGEKDPIRFRAVQKLMEEELTLSKDRSSHAKKHVAKAILKTSADGRWHHRPVIVQKAQAIDASITEVQVIAVLEQMRTRQTYHTFCERRKGGTSWSYRIVRGHGQKVDVEIVVEELSPIVQALKVEGRKHVAQASPGTIARLAHELEGILERLTHMKMLQFRSSRKEKSDESVPTREV